MNELLIGHRGVGKTTLLQRLQQGELSDRYDKFIDLDAEIVRFTQKKIAEIFRESGEVEFRRIEKQVFEKIYTENKGALIALGAGFDFDLPKDAFTFWVRRDTDTVPRILPDRPRLRPEVSVLQEHKEIFAIRERRYSGWADCEYTLPEGAFGSFSIEATLFGETTIEMSGGLTLWPHHFRHPLTLGRLKKMGFDFFELRTDLLSDEHLVQATEVFPRAQLLLSFRSLEISSIQEELAEDLDFDWACELGSCRLHRRPAVLSSHQRPTGVSLTEALGALVVDENAGAHLKVAWPCESFSDLKALHDWWKADSSHRSILPCGHGQWAWFRAYMKGRQALNFVREGSGSFADQPTLTQWIRVPSMTKEFAAVLGHPVAHSWSPQFHSDFFIPSQRPFWAIDVPERDWSVAWSFLQELGLVAAAVTSPLKGLAGEVVEASSPMNTLSLVEGQWQGDNTDVLGFQEILKELPEPADIAVYGGGGVLSVIRQTLPRAHFYSARSAEPRKGESECVAPDVVIWAIGAQAFASASPPPAHWSPKKVLDINYAEDSPGRTFALQRGSEYISGEAMFVAQAQAQQSLWSRL